MARWDSIDPKLRSVVDAARQSGEGVAISNCQVKMCRNSSSEMEIF